MIVVATQYDETTRVLHGFARTFLSGAASATFFGDANAAAIEQVLHDRPGEPFFFFGHGENPPAWGFVTHDGAVATTLGNEARFAGRTVVASCCHGDRFGPRLQSHGAEMLGYSGELWVLDASLGPVMEGALLAGPKAVASGSAVGDAAKAARKAYRSLARTMRDGGGESGPLHLFMSINAESVGTW